MTAPLPPLAEGRFRRVLADGGLFVQARTAALEASLPLAPLPPGLPRGSARVGVRSRGGPLPPALWVDLARRAVAARPLEWSAYVLYDGAGYSVVEPPVRDRGAGHVSRAPLPAALQGHLAPHVHGHGEARFSAQDDAADREGGDGIYLAVVSGRCGSAATVTEAWRRVVWRHRWPLAHPDAFRTAGPSAAGERPRP